MLKGGVRITDTREDSKLVKETRNNWKKELQKSTGKFGTSSLETLGLDKVPVETCRSKQPEALVSRWEAAGDN